MSHLCKITRKIVVVFIEGFYFILFYLKIIACISR